MSGLPLAFALYAGGLAVTLALAVGLVGWVARRERTAAVGWFVLVNATVAVWSGALLVGAVAGVLGAGRPVLVAAFQADVLGSFVIGPAYLAFALTFTGRSERLDARAWTLLAASAVVPVALGLTNHLHWLVWPEYEVLVEPFRRLRATRGPGYWAAFGWALATTLGGMGLLGQFALRSRRVSRRQLGAVLFAPVPAWLLHLASRAGVPGVLPGVEYTVIGLSVGMALVAWALFGHELFAVDPLARDAVVAAASDAIIVVDRADRVVDFNPATTDLYPDIRDRVGDPVADVDPELVADDDADGPHRFADEVVRYRGDDRTVHDVTVSAMTVGGETRGYTLALREVTARRERERQLEQQTRQLDRFVGTVSHDLRNPLTVARGYVEAAEAAGDGDADAEELARAREALDRMDRMLAEALELAREGRAIDDPELVDLAGVATDAWATTRTPGAALTVETGGTLVYADPDRLRRLFENLFRNSVEHGSTGPRSSTGDGTANGTPDGEATTGGADSGPATTSGTDDVRDRTGDGTVGDPASAGVHVRVETTGDGFSVADDGPGLPDPARVFERGYTTGEDGTGLGLAIVESIAEAHGWTVTAGESDAGGAAFRFEGVGTDRRPEDAPSTDRPTGDAERGSGRP